MYKNKQMVIDRKRKQALLATQALLNDEKYAHAIKMIADYKTMVVSALSTKSAHDISKYAMEIYGTMAEIKILDQILDGCRSPKPEEEAEDEDE